MYHWQPNLSAPNPMAVSTVPYADLTRSTKPEVTAPHVIGRIVDVHVPMDAKAAIAFMNAHTQFKFNGKAVVSPAGGFSFDTTLDAVKWLCRLSFDRFAINFCDAANDDSLRRELAAIVPDRKIKRINSEFIDVSEAPAGSA